MLRLLFTVFSCYLSITVFTQQGLSPLTVQKIMRDPKWIGTSPTSPRWTNDGKFLYFNWNPENAPADSLYYITPTSKTPVRATPAETQLFNGTGSFVYNEARTSYTFARSGDIYFVDVKSAKTKRITQTIDTESNPQFSFNEKMIVYTRSQNLYAWDIASGETIQLTNIRTAEPGPAAGRPATTTARGSTGTTAEEEWLKKDQLTYFEVLKSRKEKREKGEAYTRSLPKAKELRSISLDSKILQGLGISPDGRFVSYRLTKPVTNAKTTIVPNYVTETGYTVDIPARTKVGAEQASSEFYIYDRDRDTVFSVKPDSTLAGIFDLPDYVKDYPKQQDAKRKPLMRQVSVSGPYWSSNARYAVLDLRSQDNKDRWLVLWDTASHKLRLLDRQRDEAWIAGPGIGFGGTGWIDENNFYFQSEATGY